MEQINLFNYPEYKINKPVRLIELFAGIGAQAKALERLGVNFEHYRVCEFDKFAIKSYNAIHGTDFETSDITKISAEDLGIVDTDKYCYIMTYSFPCQDLSVAGKQKGMSRNSNTRSGLLWQVERLLKECSELPQILVMENVLQVHGKKNVNSFNEWIGFLESKGYSNYWKDLNSKNFGVPQNRNRCFMISILGKYSYNFPNEIPLNKVLLDLLENEADVDSKYYISDARIECMRNANAITSDCIGNWSGDSSAYKYFYHGENAEQYLKDIKFKENLLIILCYYWRDVKGLSWSEIKEKIGTDDLNSVKMGIKASQFGAFLKELMEKRFSNE